VRGGNSEIERFHCGRESINDFQVNKAKKWEEKMNPPPILDSALASVVNYPSAGSH
jgi:hypothetical protein